MNWIEAIAAFSRDDTGFVLITVTASRGSAPRNAGAKMVVTAERSCDTIGGGRLEFDATRAARDMLAQGKPCTELRKLTLGPDLSQCCGGEVRLLFECFPAAGFHIVLFGAGHVGRALVGILSELPCRVRWLDARPEQFPPQVAANVRTHVMKNPDEAVEQCPPGACYLVMTHCHETDMELVEAILSRGDSRYCGLIGSRTKGMRFRHRLKRRGFTPDEIARLHSPIGLPAVPGKRPMEVAVAVAAELIALHGGRQARRGTRARAAGGTGKTARLSGARRLAPAV